MVALHPSDWLFVRLLTLCLWGLLNSSSLCRPEKQKTQIYTRVCVYVVPCQGLVCLDFVKQLQNYNCEPYIWMLIVLHVFFFWGGGACVYDSLHQNTRLSVLMTIAVFQYLETFPFSFLSVIPSVISLLCYVCSFSSIVNCLFLWTNKEPYEVAKYNTVFSSFTYLFSLYQRLRLEKDFSVLRIFFFLLILIFAV